MQLFHRANVTREHTKLQLMSQTQQNFNANRVPLARFVQAVMMSLFQKMDTTHSTTRTK
jgi:hypothetical protein